MINTVFSINPCLVGSAVGILLFSNSNVNQLYLQTFIYLMHFKIYVFFASSSTDLKIHPMDICSLRYAHKDIYCGIVQQKEKHKPK